MSEIRVLTLFGEEIIPEQINAVGRSRAAKKEKKEPAEKPAKKEKKTKPVEEEQAVAETPGEKIDESITTTQEEAAAEETPVIEEFIAEKTAVPRAKKKEPIAASPKVADNDATLDSWTGDKQYYSIGEVATLFNVKTSNIRFWTKQFAMKVRTTRKGDRLYTPAQVREIRTIYHLVKEKKYTITGAKNKLKTQKNTAVQSMDVREALLQLRNKLVAIRNELM